MGEFKEVIKMNDKHKNNPILKFGIFCTLLPFYGHMDECWRLMTSMCATSRLIWNKNTVAFEILLRDYIRDTPVRSLESLKIALRMTREFNLSHFKYLIRNYEFNFKNMNHNTVLMKIVDLLNNDQILMVHKAVPYYSVESNFKYTINICSNNDFEELLHYSQYLSDDKSSPSFCEKSESILQNLKIYEFQKYKTLVLRKIEDSNLIYLHFINDLSLNLNCTVNHSDSQEPISEEKIIKLMQFNHICLRDLNICSCHINEYISSRNKCVRPQVFNRINIMYHQKHDINLIQKLISYHSSSNFYLFADKFCERSKNTILLKTQKCNCIVRLSKTSSYLIFNNLESPFDVEPIEGIDLNANQNWIVMKLNQLKTHTQSKCLPSANCSTQNIQELILNLDSKCDQPVVFIPKDKILFLSEISLDQCNSVILQHIKTLNVNVGKITKYNFEKSVSCLESIPSSIKTMLIIAKDDLIHLSSNKRVADKLLSFSNIKIKCIDHFIFEKICNKCFLVLKDNRQYIFDPNFIYFQAVRGPLVSNKNSKNIEVNALRYKRILQKLLCYDSKSQ